MASETEECINSDWIGAVDKRRVPSKETLLCRQQNEAQKKTHSALFYGNCARWATNYGHSQCCIQAHLLVSVQPIGVFVIPARLFGLAIGFTIPIEASRSHLGGNHLVQP